jgi:hypothetical protein
VHSASARRLRVILGAVITAIVFGIVARLLGLDPPTRHLAMLALAVVALPPALAYSTGRSVVITPAQTASFESLSVIHCVLNEAHTIGALASSSLAIFRQLEIPGEVIVAEGESSDETFVVASSVIGIRVLTAPPQFGRTARAGVEAATSSLALIAAGELSVTPWIVEGLLSALGAGADVAVAEIREPSSRRPPPTSMYRLASPETHLQLLSDRSKAIAVDSTLLRNARRHRLTVVIVEFPDDRGPRATRLTAWPWISLPRAPTRPPRARARTARRRAGYARS